MPIFKEKSQKAVVWIRDGVLIHRMHINPVAFAFAAWRHVAPEEKENPFLLGDLISFAFAKSGFSCLQKAQMFNREANDIIQNVEAVATDYDIIAAKAAEDASCFAGAVDLLSDLRLSGILNFITSAVSQSVLDEWARQDSNGRLILPHLAEILGSKPDFAKGKDHFAYIKKMYRAEKIYYVADAASEIKTGATYSSAYNILPVGFANVITHADVKRGISLVQEAIKTLYKIDTRGAKIDLKNLSLPSEAEIKTSLNSSGAVRVVIRSKLGIMRNLRNYFKEVGLFNT